MSGLRLQRGEHVLHAPAVDDGERMQQHLPADHFVEQRARRRSGLDLVFARLDAGRETLPSRVEDPCPRLCDHSPRCEIGSDAREAAPGATLKTSGAETFKGSSRLRSPLHTSAPAAAKQRRAARCQRHDDAQRPHTSSKRARSRAAISDVLDAECGSCRAG